MSELLNFILKVQWDKVTAFVVLFAYSSACTWALFSGRVVIVKHYEEKCRQLDVQTELAKSAIIIAERLTSARCKS